MAGHAHAHDPHVAHHFENADQQFQSANLGMWVFLATEILFFGGLFCAYAVYRSNHPEVFFFAHHFLDKNLGAVNTVILICSSFTMAWAVRAAQLRQQGMIKLMLGLTLLFAVGFLGVKTVEYQHKWHHGLLWAGKYNPDVVHHGEEASAASPEATAAEPAPPAADAAAPTTDAAAGGFVVERSKIAPAATGPAGLADSSQPVAAAAEPEPANARVFFSIYFLMTGLHGIHVLGGMGAMLWLLACVRRGDFVTGPYTKVHMVGLYWHLVDLIWIYLFLLLYLIH